MSSLREMIVSSIVICAPALAFVGCSRETPVEVPAPVNAATDSSPTPPAEKSQRPRSWACTQLPGGNNQTQRFLAWSRLIHPMYCDMQLDSHGDCIALDIHPCWPAKDEDLAKIAELKQVRSLTFNASSVTDKGLQQLENMPALKTLRMVGASQITEEGLEHLKTAHPNLEITLPYRKTS